MATSESKPLTAAEREWMRHRWTFGMEADLVSRLLTERDTLEAQLADRTKRLAALRDQVESGGCAAAHIGETSLECDATKPCGLCRLNAQLAEARGIARRLVDEGRPMLGWTDGGLPLALHRGRARLRRPQLAGPEGGRMMPASQPKNPPVIQFRADTHEYFVNNRPVRSVTQIVRAMPECAKEYDTANLVWMERARGLGEHVDLCCRLLADGDLDWASVDERAVGYVQGFEKFLHTYGTLTTTQRIVYHPALDYCGTMDEFRILDGHRTVIEWKRTRSPMKSHAYQTAGYAMPGLTFADGSSVTAERRVLLYLHAGDYELWRDDRPAPGTRRKALFAHDDYSTFARACQEQP